MTRASLSLLVAASLLAMPLTVAAQAAVDDTSAQATPALMVKDVLPIDLPTALKLAQANNIDIAEAQQRIRATRGDLHASIGSALPAVGVGVGAVDLEGAIAASGGTYQVGRFNRVSPMAFVTWILNPGQAIFDILAARRRLEASKLESESTRLIVRRDVALAFYDLAKAQAHVSTTLRQVQESDELVRLAGAREKAGLGLPLDTERAQAAHHAAQITAIQGLNAYYIASVKLTQLLNLDPKVMLVPTAGALQMPDAPATDQPLESLLAKAFMQRPDLASLRKRLGATDAVRVSTLFAGLGPQVQASGTLANTPPAQRATDTMFRQQLYGGAVGVTLSASLIGKLQDAGAAKALANLEVERDLEAVRASVVLAQQAQLAAARVVPLATAQLQAAQVGYQLARSGLQAGTAVVHEVLLAQSDLAAAREAYDMAIANLRQAQIGLDFAIGQPPETKG